jgi:hypothetical protein
LLQPVAHAEQHFRCWKGRFQFWAASCINMSPEHAAAAS